MCKEAGAPARRFRNQPDWLSVDRDDPSGVDQTAVLRRTIFLQGSIIMKKRDKTILEQLAQYVKSGTVDEKFISSKIDETESSLRGTARFLNNKYKENGLDLTANNIMRKYLLDFANEFLSRARPLLTISEIVKAKISIPNYVELNESKNVALIQGIINRIIIETKLMNNVGMYYYHNSMNNNYLHLEAIFLVNRQKIQSFLQEISEINKYYTDIAISHDDFITFARMRCNLETLNSETFRIGHHVPRDSSDATGTTANAIKAKAMAKKVSAKEFRLIFPRSSSAQKSTGPS